MNKQDVSWIKRANEERPVHRFNIYTGEDFGVTSMTEAEREQFKAVKQSNMPVNYGRN